MNTGDLLRIASPNAFEYVRTAINSESTADYRKLGKLLNDGIFEANNFPDLPLDILAFDWQSDGFDRNWWWQLQALPFLNWFCSSFQLQDATEKARYYALCRDGVLRWVEQASTNSESPLAWHDHASAFRVRNLVNWLIFCHLHGLEIDKDPKAQPLASLIIRHLDWLQKTENYSRHTNHGFDQAMIGLMIGLMFASDQFAHYRDQNRRRLADEVSFAFTEQGVHKENSPGYQKMMLARIRQLAAFSNLGEHQISEMGRSYIEAATNFLRAITLPDGNLPLIGDTRGKDTGLPYVQKDRMDILDYTESGYAIIRGQVFNREFHLVFKNSHISQYHRHDDDLSVHLYFDGHTLLGDGGLGSHNESDPQRILLRSGLAHNVPYIVDHQPIRAVVGLNGWAPRTRITGEKIVGESFCHGIAIRRELDFSRLSEGRLVIRDSAPGGKTPILATNYYSALGLVRQDSTLLTHLDTDYSLRISAAKNTRFKFQESCFSSEFGKFSKVRAVSLSSENRAALNAIETTLDLIPTPT